MKPTSYPAAWWLCMGAISVLTVLIVVVTL